MAEPGPPDRPTQLPDPPALAPVTADAPTRAHGFLFADLRGYTGYVETRGDHAGALLLGRYRALVREAVAAARGAEIKTEGDSFYVVFDSASAAVRCGLAIVEAATRTADGPADAIQVGVGVHAGETVETTEGYVGSAVNLAARLCAEAKAGDLVVSDTVRGLTRTSLEVEFQPLGARRLKGVPEPMTLYRVVPRDATGIPTTHPVGRRPSRLLAAGLGAVALVALVAVGVIVLFRGGQAAAPTPGPSAAGAAARSDGASASPATSAAGSSQPSTTSPAIPTASPTPGPFPDQVEAAILTGLPSALAQTCGRGGTASDARLAGFSSAGGSLIAPISRGGVTCHPTTGAQRVYIMAPITCAECGFAQGPADDALGKLAARWKIPDGSCAIEDRAHERWTGQLGTGLLACMNPYEGRPWIYFTFNKGQYLAFATRDDSNYGALYAWWDQLKTFLP
jgi:class 3 adenylate cyclase